MRIWRALVCLERKLMPLGLSRVLFVLDKSALIEWRTPMRSSGGFAKFPELQNGQHNGWPCAHFGSPTHFRRLTAILRTRSIWSVRVNLKNTRWLGAHGELTRQCISGLSPAKSRSAKMGANLPHARKGSVEKLASTAESQRACDTSHSGSRPRGVSMFLGDSGRMTGKPEVMDMAQHT
jgi:hypothetical protein